MLREATPLESIAHRELEAFLLVSPGGDAVAVLGVDGHPEAESEEAERRQPLHREPDGAPDAVPAGEAVIDGTDVVGTVELDRVAGVVDPAHIEEQADAGGLGVLGRHGKDELVLAGETHVAAIRVAELVLGTQAALAVAAHVVRAAAEEIPIGRDRSGVAERFAVVDALEEGEEEAVPDRHVLD